MIKKISILLIFFLIGAGLVSNSMASAAGEAVLLGTTVSGKNSDFPLGGSILVEIDSETGNTKNVIGPVGYSVNGLEYDRTTGKLFASTSAKDPNYNGLIEINLVTGVGTPVPSPDGKPNWGGADPRAITNITIDSHGQMYGFSEFDPSEVDPDDVLVIIDKGTGIPTGVGGDLANTATYGLSFDKDDTLYLINFDGRYYTLDTGTGTATEVGFIHDGITFAPNGDPIGTVAHHGDFHPVTNLYYGINSKVQPGSNTPDVRSLVVADLSEGTTVTPTIVGAFEDRIHTLAFISANNPPVAKCKGTVVYLDADGNASIKAEDVDNGSFDPDGDPITLSLDKDTFDCNDIGANNSVTLTVSDGNLSDTCIATVTVIDNTKPVLSGVPTDATAECDSVPDPANPTATDNCDLIPTIAYSELRTDGSCVNSYTLARTWMATDDTGNSSSQTQTITVQDTTAPVLVGVPTDLTVECDSVPDPANPTAIDNCDTNPTIDYSEVRTDDDCADSYTLSRTWTATDSCGNSSSQTQIVTAQDTTAPVIECPADIVVNNDTGVCGAVVTYNVTSSDNCDDSPTIIITPGSGSTFDVGITTVTATATDACGNASSCSFTVTVNDNENPTITCPEDKTLEFPADTSVAANGSATATDNCSVVSITHSDSPVSDCGDTEVITRTWTATDGSGNAATCTQAIIVQDTTAPVLVGVPTDLTVQCDSIPAVANPTASDDCDLSPNVTYDGEERTDGNLPGYTLTRTWTATDSCGNSNIQKQIITVQDTAAPTISATVSPGIHLPPNHKMVDVVIQANATDNCGSVTLSATVESSEPPDSDGDGNTIPDFTEPVIDQDTGVITLQLRSERKGQGTDRTYTITVTATNGSGNSSDAVVEVVDPHDKGKKGKKGKK